MNDFYALKFAQEHGLGLFSDAFDGVQFGMSLGFAALVAVEGDGETVHFILDAGEEFEEFAVGLKSHCDRRKAEKKFVGAVLIVFGKSSDGDVEVELVFNYGTDYVHLSAATIRDDEVG
jgi:hypothetical protein